ncbi:hypothetical protein B9479_008189 [Cryptococcus floricola]|uniref:Uncharacterized protein n=1 Tax=Cryptococcus floricola TaxID=2591691 RepID=A0A5D3AM08_9TREE|nr:hypothetical protein B9479_008189 [Cryptococcus floricola]
MGDRDVSITPSMACRLSSRSDIDQSVGMEDEDGKNDNVFVVRGTRDTSRSTDLTSNHGVADEPTSGARGAGSLSNASRARASLDAQDTPTSGKGRRGNTNLNEQLQGLFKDHSTANIKGRKEIAEQEAQAALALEQYKVAEQATRFEEEMRLKSGRLEVEDERYEVMFKLEQEERELKRKRDADDAHWRNVKAQREELRAQDEIAAKEFERKLIKEYVADGDTREEAKRKAIEETRRRFTYD